jgi:hypothetical protein
MDENIYSPPKAGLDSLAPDQAARPASRGGCLTAFLLFALIANTLTSIAYVWSLIQGTMFGQPLPPQWAVVLLCIGGAINIASCAAVWKWRRWGVYSFFGTTAVAFGVNVALGVPVVSLALGLLGAVILAVLIRPIWRYMR